MRRIGWPMNTIHLPSEVSIKMSTDERWWQSSIKFCRSLLSICNGLSIYWFASNTKIFKCISVRNKCCSFWVRKLFVLIKCNKLVFACEKLLSGLTSVNTLQVNFFQHFLIVCIVNYSTGLKKVHMIATKLLFSRSAWQKDRCLVMNVKCRQGCA